MMDYVKGGTKLNFMCAIDFTMSNRHPTDPTSLHHTAPGAFNEYEQAIAAIGGIIMEYDEDKMPICQFYFSDKVRLAYRACCWTCLNALATPDACTCNTRADAG